MKSFILIGLLVCSQLSLMAQMDVSETVFNGETYKVYPVRLDYAPLPEHYDYKRGFDLRPLKKAHKRKIHKEQGRILRRDMNDGSLEQKLQYNPFSLPDGKYVAHYIKIPYENDKNRIPVFRDEDLTRVAAVFTIKDNLLDGEATWYDYFNQDLVVQKSNYVRGLKNGNWQTSMNKTVNSYQYSMDTLHGEYMCTYKNRLVELGTFDRGLMTKYKRYYTTRKKRLSAQTLGDVQYRYYKSGATRSIENQSDTATFEERKFSKKGLLTKQTVLNKLDTTRIILYYNSKGLKSCETVDAHYGSRNRSYRGIKTLSQLAIESSGNWPTQDDIISFKCFDSKGNVKFSYTDGKTGAVLVDRVNKKGQPLEKLYFTQDSTIINEKWDKNRYTIIHYSKFNWANSEWYKEKKREVYNNGELVSMKYEDPEILSSLYPDSLGFALCRYEKWKKRTLNEYYLLQNGYVKRVYTNNKTGISTGDFEYKVSQIGADTMLWLSRKEYSRDRRFYLVHEKSVVYPIFYKNDLEAYYDYSNTKKKGEMASWISSSLGYYQDTILYKAYYNDQLVNGKLNITRQKRKDHGEMGKVKVKENKYGKIVYDVPYTKSKYSSSYLNIKNGVPNGKGGEGYKHKVVYQNGIKEGQYEGEVISGFYLNGQKHGRIEDRNVISQYKYNLLEGEYTELGIYHEGSNVPQIRFRAHYSDGVLHGPLQRYAYPYVTYEDAIFDHGILQGKYTSGTEANNKLVEVTLKNGQLIDTGRYFFKEGTLKCEVVYKEENGVLPYYSSSYEGVKDNPTPSDTALWDDYLVAFYKQKASGVSPENSSYYSRQRNIFIAFNSNLTGDYTYYYKSGVVSMTGSVENATKVGTWKYYDVNGGLYKEVTYDSGIYLLPNTGDTIVYYAKIMSYHPNGKLLLKGLVKDETSRFKCEIEQSIAMEEVHYLEFYDRSGNQMIKEEGGYVYQYYNDGAVSLEGSYFNGKREGLWKFYDPDGMLEEIGEYENGKKSGIWYKGDLQGVPYFDNACDLGVIADEPSLLPVSASTISEKIEIVRTSYVKGWAYYNDNLILYPY